jgi:hypothetical protein
MAWVAKGLIENMNESMDDPKKILNACLEWFFFNHCYCTLNFIATLQVRPFFKNQNASKFRFNVYEFRLYDSQLHFKIF